MRKFWKTYLLPLVAILAFVSCNNEKYLAPGEYLYNGSKIVINAKKEVPHVKTIKSELEELDYPETNTLFLGARTKLWFYNTTKDTEKEKGFRYWKKYKLGEPPVLLKHTDPERVSKLMKNHLYNSGHFSASAKFKVVPGEKEARIVYTIEIDTAYQINEVFYPEEQNTLMNAIRSTQPKSLLKKGDSYKLKTLKDERQRINRELRSQGFYFFDEDFLMFEVDSTAGNQTVNIYLKVKAKIDEKYLNTYRIGKIYVYPHYSLDQDSLQKKSDTVYINGCYYLLQDSAFRPEIISDAVYLQSGKLYNVKGHDYTVQRLMGLGGFQFVNIQYQPDPDTSGFLTAHIYLTPFIKKSIRLEVSVTSKSNGFTGPGFKASFRNRNALRGSEQLTVNLETGYETQISGSQAGLNSFDVGLNTELLLPRFITPFNIEHTRSKYIPKTSFKMGFRILDRVNYFRTNSYEAAVGYKWRESVTKLHELYPISLNFVNLASTKPAFDSILAANPLVRRSFEEQFILGSIYNYTFNSKLKQKRKHDFYFEGIIDLAGNLVGTFLNRSNAEGADSSFSFRGTPFSQYVRFETTFIHYFNISKKSQIANRIITGLGLPTGNSTVLPYIKQFFIGGSNSIRAFQTRSLGPGSFRADESHTGSIFLDQSGDIKLEANTEFRFTIFEIFKGAIFLDVGNIWLANEDPKRPGGAFDSKRFINELAVGSGFGFRIDPDFFIIRLDFGIPLRKPFLPEGERWVGSNVDIASSEWRKDNLILNIAIGYPF